MSDPITCTVVNGGLLSDKITGVTREALWHEFVVKVFHPDHYLPVVNVKTSDNEDGSVHREMELAVHMNDHMHKGRVLVEDITMDEEKGVCKFQVLDAEGKPTREVHYNFLHEEDDGSFRIEYCDIDPVTNEKKPLMGGVAIQKKVANARAAMANQ
eukprot:comp17893_c0_seq1/m.18136 comp17893_c0_seq1/g.18136  ORF comp17893_c0_seq1/g.18136 comp17893_c0_seq1/m.18136 type:complete len:156 (-) comp17893_c0_seq1:379-846(-)